MDRYLEAYDWSHTDSRRGRPVPGARERLERPHEERESERSLEPFKLSLSAILSAWGLYLTMMAGLVLFSALYSPDIHDIGALDLSRTMEGNGDITSPSREAAAPAP